MYHRPRPPVPGPVKVHPLVPVNVGGLHDGSISPGLRRDGSISTGLRHDGSIASGLMDPGGPRVIAGQTALLLRPIGSGYTPRGGSAVGWSLRRDFPVDRWTREPVLGVESTTGPVTPVAGALSGWSAHSGRPGGEVVRGAGGADGGTSQGFGQGAVRPVMRPPPPIGGALPTVQPGSQRGGPLGRYPGSQPGGPAPTRSVPVRPPASMAPRPAQPISPPPMMRPAAPAAAPARPAAAAPAATPHR